MDKIRFSEVINAPREHVWNIALGDETFREWTSVFNPAGSWFEGEWTEGSKIRFLGAGEDGKLGGMVSRIAANRPFEYVSIQHLGIVQDGVEDTTSDAVKKWAPAFENYTFKERDGGTEMIVEMDIDKEHRATFEEMWPRALAKLKDLAER
jgi:hypothetical protein